MNHPYVSTSLQLRVKRALPCALFLLFLTGYITPCLAKATYHSDIFSTERRNTRLMVAIQTEDVKKVKSLLAEGIELNESNNHGETALMAAAAVGNVDILRLLITAGADIDACDHTGNTALFHALYFSSSSTSDTRNPERAVGFLLSKKASCEVMNDQEQTPLILAALNGHTRSVNLLIKEGAHLESKGLLGRTALMHAIDNDQVDVALLLIKQGADIETRDQLSLTPLMLCALRNTGAIARELIKKGAQKDAQTTVAIPVKIDKNPLDRFSSHSWFQPDDFVNIPIGSTALTIAQQFQKRTIEALLKK